MEHYRKTVLRDFDANDFTPAMYSILGLDEAPWDEVIQSGMDPDTYVFGQCADAVRGCKGRPVYMGIGVDAPRVRADQAVCTPDIVYRSVLATYRAGGEGVVYSPNYAGMNLSNLDGGATGSRGTRPQAAILCILNCHDPKTEATMPEQAPWRFQKIIRPMVDIPTQHIVLVGRVLTCIGDEIIENGFVEIEGKAIKRVGRTSDLGATAARVIETGGTILPGLIQSHGHLAWDGIHDLAAQSMDDGPEIAAYKCASNMLVNLKAGVTTFRDLGVNRTNLFAKQAVAQGIFPGPRLLVCGQAIVQTGGHTYWCCREASGPDEMRRAVREQVRGGADLIKIMACHDTLEFTDEELEAVIDESHRNKLPITAHATFDACINRVVRFLASTWSSMGAP